MADLLNLGLSGLRTSRNSLSVTGHNISNVDTPGYARQRTVQVTNNPAYASAGYLGMGARTHTIERVVDQYTLDQVRVDTSRMKDHEAFLRQASELDSLLATQSSALGQGLNLFFDGLQTLANDPLSQPGRELVFSQAESISQRFNTAQARLMDQNKNINTQLRTQASKLNSLAQEMADLNRRIMSAQGASVHAPNDLLNRRDEVLREMSEYVDLQAFTQDGQTVNVMIGEGIPLVIGDSARQLAAVPGQDKNRYEIQLSDPREGEMFITGFIKGGEMGGVLRYRQEALDPALNEMGRLAVVLAGEINQLHHQGIDRDGNQGGDFFRDMNHHNAQLDRIPGLQRDTPAGVWIDPEGLSKLPAGEFLLKQNVSGQLLVQAIPSGKTQAGPFTTIVELNNELEAQLGFRLTNGSPGTDLDPDTVANFLQQGLLITPTRFGAAELARSPDLNETNKLALAGIAGDEHNRGDARLGYGDLAGQNLRYFNGHSLAGAELVFDVNTDQWMLTTPQGQDFGPIPATTDGQLVFGINGVDLTLNLHGQPAEGDRWVLEGGAGGSNVGALARLQTTPLIERDADGRTGMTLGENYSILVERVAIQTSETRAGLEVSRATLNQTLAMRESISGVNMDEEAANLIRYQMAYQASSQVIAAAQKLFDTLINSVGR